MNRSTRTMAVRWAGVMLLALGVASCSNDNSLTSPTSPAQLDGTWRLFELTDASGVHREDLNAGRFSLGFTAGTVQVKADCNTCTGVTALGGATLTIGNLSCTRAACGSTPVDTRFTAILGSPLTVRISDRLLQLNSTAGGSASELRLER